MDLLSELLTRGILIPMLGAAVGAACSAYTNKKPPCDGEGSRLTNTISGDGNTINNNLINSNNTINHVHNHTYTHAPNNVRNYDDSGEAIAKLICAIIVTAVLVYYYAIYAPTLFFWIERGTQFIGAAVIAYSLIGAYLRTRPLTHWISVGGLFAVGGTIAFATLGFAKGQYNPQLASSARYLGIKEFFLHGLNDNWRIFILLQILAIASLCLAELCAFTTIMRFRPDSSKRFIVVNLATTAILLGVAYYCASGETYTLLLSLR